MNYRAAVAVFGPAAVAALRTSNPLDAFRRRDPAADAIARELTRDETELVARRWGEAALGGQPRPVSLSEAAP